MRISTYVLNTNETLIGWGIVQTEIISIQMFAFVNFAISSFRRRSAPAPAGWSVVQAAEYKLTIVHVFYRLYGTYSENSIWCRGIIVPSHGTDRGSIPRMRICPFTIFYFYYFHFVCLSWIASCNHVPSLANHFSIMLTKPLSVRVLVEEPSPCSFGL